MLLLPIALQTMLVRKPGRLSRNNRCDKVRIVAESPQNRIEISFQSACALWVEFASIRDEVFKTALRLTSRAPSGSGQEGEFVREQGIVREFESQLFELSTRQPDLPLA